MCALRGRTVGEASDELSTFTQACLHSGMIHDVQREHLPAEIAIEPRFGGRFYEIPTPHLNGSPARATERVRRLQIGDDLVVLDAQHGSCLKTLISQPSDF